MFGKMAKKGKAIASEKSYMTPLFSNTTCNKDIGTTSWEAMYNILEEEKPKPLETKATANAEESSDASYFEVACSFCTQNSYKT